MPVQAFIVLDTAQKDAAAALPGTAMQASALASSGIAYSRLKVVII